MCYLVVRARDRVIGLTVWALLRCAHGAWEVSRASVSLQSPRPCCYPLETVSCPCAQRGVVGAASASWRMAARPLQEKEAAEDFYQHNTDEKLSLQYFFLPGNERSPGSSGPPPVHAQGSWDVSSGHGFGIIYTISNNLLHLSRGRCASIFILEKLQKLQLQPRQPNATALQLGLPFKWRKQGQRRGLVLHGCPQPGPLRGRARALGPRIAGLKGARLTFKCCLGGVRAAPAPAKVCFTTSPLCPLPCLAGWDLGVVRSPQPHSRQPLLLWEMLAAGVESSVWPGPSACLGTRLVQCCKSGVALTVNTLQQKLQIIIVECFIAVIKL